MTRLDDLLNRVPGIFPAKKFLERLNTRSNGALVKESGIAPLRLFPARLTYLREAAAPSDRGMLPARFFRQASESGGPEAQLSPQVCFQKYHCLKDPAAPAR